MYPVAHGGQEGQSREVWWWMEELPQPDQQVPWLLFWQKWLNSAQISAGFFFFLSSLQEFNFCVLSEFQVLLWIHLDCQKNSCLHALKHLSKLSPLLRSPLLIHQVSRDLISHSTTFTYFLQESPDSASTKVLHRGELRCLMRSGAHLQRFGLQWHLGLWRKKRLMIITAFRTSEWQ